LGKLKSELQNRTIEMLKEKFGGQLGLNPVWTGGPGAGGPAETGLVGAEEAFPGASTAGTSGTPKAFSAMMAEAGLPEFPAMAAGTSPFPGYTFTAGGNLIPTTGSLAGAGGGLAGGTTSAAGSAIGAGAEGGIAAGGAGNIGAMAGGSIAGAIAIPLAGLTLATMLQGP